MLVINFVEIYAAFLKLDILWEAGLNMLMVRLLKLKKESKLSEINLML